MDIGSTIGRVKKAYAAHLRETHPNWAESTLRTHVSDAFYLYQNTVVPSFWKCFADDASMAAAKAALFDYLAKERMSDRAEERAAGYYRDLCMLKAFLDDQGGVRECIGYEYDCEATVYQFAKKSYEGALSLEDAAAAMHAAVPCFGQNSHKTFVSVFQAMMAGRKYTWKLNTEATLYFITHIGADFGHAHLVSALRATQQNLQYYYEQTGSRSQSIRRGCAKLASENGVDMRFDDSIFDGIIPKQATDPALAADDSAIRYWLYAAGDGSANWERDHAEGVMAIGWHELGDLAAYSAKADMRAQMRELYGDDDGVLAAWQFANEVKAGDIIIVKRGRSQLIGRGVVTGEYHYQPDRGEYPHVRAVRWTDKGEWPAPEPNAMKTLTDITPYTEYVKTILRLLDGDHQADGAAPKPAFEPYTDDDFLQDVYMDEPRYRTLKALLLTKKNIILEGAPGVGKTYAAMRLAYAMMGEKDRSRVQMVQFHQSYGYEDFIMGFRPTAGGFALKRGVFYEFCHRASEDDRPYFFIIDEINRGNLSKIFGEAFMLLESDKRGVSLQLLYAEEQFTIPANVYIIGMMNTADRSLALLDYALRRRFAFFQLSPAFGSAGFQSYRAKIDNKRFDRLIATVERLNEAIAEDDALGEGFCIGHSYFCASVTVSDEWMQSVVAFELIPLLKEYWFDEPAKVRDWSRALREALQ